MKDIAMHNTCVALDIGSSQINAVMISNSNPNTDSADKNESRNLHILAAAKIPNSSIKKGTIIDFDSLTSSIQEVLDELERQSGIEIDSINTNISGQMIQCDNYSETIQVKNNEVKESDILRLKQTVINKKAQAGFEYIHLIPTYYILDGKSGIINPVGMWGSELSAIYHRIVAPQNDIKNIIRACNTAGVRVNNIAFEALAAAESVLTSDEKDLGVCCINFGNNQTHLAIYALNVPIFCRDYSFGSNHITKDLSIGLRTTLSEAERIKREFGNSLYIPDANYNDPITLTGIDAKTTRNTTKGEIANIIEPRVKEIFTTIYQDLKKQKLTNHLTKGIVLTGGGALLVGFCSACEEIFNTNARIGTPLSLSGFVEGLRNPNSATSLGLFSPLFSNNDDNNSSINSVNKDPKHLKSVARNFWQKMLEPFN